jgi:hypothetical protein
MIDKPKRSCVQCGRDESQVPLVVLHYKEEKFWICTEHFPILIHKPQELAGVLPGAENIQPGDHD